LADWLQAEGVESVAMESTGIYWMPVYAELEQDFDLTVANAQHMKAVPGRKTDMCDAEWIAQLLRMGLLRKSFIPPSEFRVIRDLARARRSLIQDRAREVNRLHKVLAIANVKLAQAISDITGVSGTEMVRALVEGTLTIPEMARLARGSMRKKIPLIERALDSRLLDHHKFLLRHKLGHIDLIDTQIAELDAEIGAEGACVRAFAVRAREDLQIARDVRRVLGDR
jgi:transposase